MKRIMKGKQQKEEKKKPKWKENCSSNDKDVILTLRTSTIVFVCLFDVRVQYGSVLVPKCAVRTDKTAFEKKKEWNENRWMKGKDKRRERTKIKKKWIKHTVLCYFYFPLKRIFLHRLSSFDRFITFWWHKKER